MIPFIKRVRALPEDKATVVILGSKPKATDLPVRPEEKKPVLKRFREGKSWVEAGSLGSRCFLVKAEKRTDRDEELELLRRLGHRVYKRLEETGTDEIYILNQTLNSSYTLAIAEGLALSSYRFTPYLTDKKLTRYRLRRILLVSGRVKSREIERLSLLVDAVFRARDLVNEPVSTLNATRLGEEFQKMGNEAGLKVEVFNKKKIESLRMGGLLAVNKGSIDPPTFTVLEWKPEGHLNKKPYVLVGKGVVYDTGGLSLKPTKNSMDEMKCDMAGAATVATAMFAMAKAGFPLHIIGLAPATDNRPDGNAYAPGDVVTMHSGKTVEVLNTDAEGRMILADALSYARQYKPALVINLATLTGSAAMAIGHQGMVGMGNAPSRIFRKLQQSGQHVQERIVEFPFWDDYRESLKSDIADLKNIGGRDAGAITAGKFLEYFTNYPFIHLDIAGVAFTEKEVSYWGKGGTGVGVRLLFDFFESLIK